MAFGKYPRGTKAAPPFSTMNGCPFPRARRQNSTSARVLLVTNTQGTPCRFNRSSAGLAASQLYVSRSSSVPSRSVKMRSILYRYQVTAVGAEDSIAPGDHFPARMAVWRQVRHEITQLAGAFVWIRHANTPDRPPRLRCDAPGSSAAQRNRGRP